MTSQTERPTLGVIGAGKVGMALARLFSARGYAVAAVWSRDAARSRVLANAVGAAAQAESEDVLRRADLTLLTVPDDAIARLAAHLAPFAVPEHGVVHTSGAHSAESLDALAVGGMRVGSLHPAFPFASVETALERLPGAAFAVEAEDERLRAWLLDMVRVLEGHALVIPTGEKARYHAALVLASNYTVTLYALAEQLLLSLDADWQSADAALNALVGATVENLRLQGVPDALTGPLVRADAGTVAAHLTALRAYEPEIAALYQQLARLTLPLVRARGVDTAGIEALLEQVEP
jgi:predicted short-subunit dehydrogenase-like oxidoreductase (DUF2520 family)